MQKSEFKEWLEKKEVYKTEKQVFDCLSRVSRTEKVLKTAFGENFSLDDEFEKDGGDRVFAILSKKGINSEMDKFQGLDLPIGSNQMYVIKSAVKEYFIYLANVDN